MGDGAEKVIFEMIEPFKLLNLLLGSGIETSLTDGNGTLTGYLLHKVELKITKFAARLINEAEIAQQFGGFTGNHDRYN